MSIRISRLNMPVPIDITNSSIELRIIGREIFLGNRHRTGYYLGR